jgi:microcystin degradation protein MlrC
MKFVIALIRHETNTFSPVPTQLSDFRRGTTLNGPAYGDAARMACEGTNSAAAAYLDLARDMGADVDFAVCANAVPSGLVTREAFEHLCDTVVHSAQQGCDAILLDLHGAMVVDGYADAEGELLRRLRACTPAGLPIGVALDFHANFSRELIRHATAIAGYCTYPHVDVYETGARVGAASARCWSAAAPGAAVAPPAHADHMLRQTPAMQPMKDIMDRAMQAERDGEVCNASVFGGFPLSDIPCAGFSVVIVTERDRLAQGQQLLDELCTLAWRAARTLSFPPRQWPNRLPRPSACRRAR